MQTLYEIRESIIAIANRYQTVISFLLKFIAGVVIYSSIASIGHTSPALSALNNLGFVVIAFLAVLLAILPLNANYLFIVLFTTLQFSSQFEIALIVFLGLLSMFLFYGHFGKKEGVLVLATILGFQFNLPFLVPLMAGLYFGITSVIPMAIGVFIFSYGRMIIELISDDTAMAGAGAGVIGIEIDYILEAFADLYQNFALGGDAMQGLIVITFAMFVPFIFVYIVSRLSINYKNELAILTGSVLNIFGFIFASLFTDFGIGFAGIIFFATVSGLLMLCYNFLHIALDYKSAQNVEFQDEDYYYYVKLVPKKSSAARPKPPEKRTAQSIRDELDNTYSPPPPRRRPEPTPPELPQRTPRPRGSNPRP